MVSWGRSGKVRLIRDNFTPGLRSRPSCSSLLISLPPPLPPGCLDVMGNVGKSAYLKTNVKLMGRRGKVGQCELWHYVMANDPTRGDSSVFCFPLCKWGFFFSPSWFSLRPVDLKKSPQPENEMRRVVIYLWKWKKWQNVRVRRTKGAKGFTQAVLSAKFYFRFYFLISFCVTAR